MIKKGLALGLLLFAGAAAQAQITYCTPSPGVIAGCNAGATNIRINSITTAGGTANINNSNNTCQAGGYIYYSGPGNFVRQTAGLSVTMNITSSAAAPYAYRACVWVDWNQDGVFDNTDWNFITNKTGERMYVSPTASFSGTYTGITIPVPLTAKNGITRMRIRSGTNSNLGTPPISYDPCLPANFQYGEVEDYDFDVYNPCLPPSTISITDVTSKSATVKWTKKVNAKFYEYIIKTDAALPAPGNYFTTDSIRFLPDTNNPSIVCNTKYYVFVRSVCDTANKPTQYDWDQSAWKVDSFTTQPCCYTPEVTINNITSYTAIASWNPVPSVVKYEYIISVDTNMKVPTTSGIITTQTSIFMQGLSPATDYIFWLRALCSPTPTSDWSRSTFLTQPGLGIKSPASKGSFEIEAYPNPVGNEVTLKVVHGVIAKDAAITLTDVTGKVLLTQPVTNVETKVIMAGYPAGIYIVKYFDGTNSQVIKVTKQ